MQNYGFGGEFASGCIAASLKQKALGVLEQGGTWEQGVLLEASKVMCDEPASNLGLLLIPLVHLDPTNSHDR